MGATNWEQKWFQNLVLAINMAYCLLPCFFSPLNSLSWVVQFVAHLTTTSGKIPAILSAAFDLYPCGIFCFAGNGNLPFGHQHESHSTALGWCSAVKQQQPNHSFSTCPCFFIWETSSMVISGMNILYVCARVCPAALPATVAINEEYQAAEQDTHQLDVCIPPQREQCCANETGREI